MTLTLWLVEHKDVAQTNFLMLKIVFKLFLQTASKYKNSNSWVPYVKEMLLFAPRIYWPDLCGN